MAEYVSNTSPLQYLHQVNQLSLLRSLFGGVRIPEAVRSEIEAGQARGASLPDLNSLPWIQIVSVGSIPPLPADLGSGEREVLALASRTPGSIAVLDDGLARKHATLLNIPVVGTLGILLRGKAQGLVKSVLPIISELEALGFRLSFQTRRAVLEIAGETLRAQP